MKRLPLFLFAAAVIGIPAIAAETAPAPVGSAPEVKSAAPAKPATAEKVAVSATTGRITANVLNVRLNADIKSPSVKKLRNGDKVTITGMKGNWCEIAAPQGTVLYASGVYLREGKALEKTHLRIAAGGSAAIAATIARGETVKVLGDAGHGWVKVEAPASLKLYVVKLYVEAEDKAAEQTTDAPKAEEKKAETPAAAVKQNAKTAQTAASAPEKKADAAKQDPKAAQTAAPAPVKKDAPKKVTQSAAVKLDSAKVRAEQDKALKSLGLDPAKPGKAKTLTGRLIRIKESKNSASDYALMFSNNDFTFICTVPEAVAELVDKNVTVHGDLFQPAEWKHGVLRADSFKLVR